MTDLCNGVVIEIEPPSVIDFELPNSEVLVIPVAGPEGPPSTTPGPAGPPGTPGSAPQAYHHDQGVPSDSWLIPHNLGYNPAGIVVHDSGGNEWEGVVTYLDPNHTRIDFDVAFGGEADLS